MRIALFLAAALFVAASGARGQVLPASFDLAQIDGSRRLAPSAEPVDPSAILITGRRLRGAASGDVPPLFSYDERDVAAFGAGTLGELVEALSPHTRAAGGGPPAILVNGQRIAGFAEVRELPPEAVERIEVLPEEVALRYGYGGDRRVVNIVLRPRFAAVTAEATHEAPTAGGRHSVQARVNVARIGDEGRWNAHARFAAADALLESERPVTGGEGRLRSLLPRSRQAALGGSFTADAFRGVPATLTVGLLAEESQARIGPSLAGKPARPLRREGRTRALNAGLSLNGALGGWQWLLTGSADRSAVRTATDVPDSVRRDVVRTDSALAEAQLLLNGPVAALPAGDAYAAVKLDAGWNRLSARSRLDDEVRRSRVSRRRGAAEATLDLPITGSGTMDWIGNLSANLRIGAAHLSDFHMLESWGGGLRWAPAGWLSVTASFARDDLPPTMDELGAALLVTPNLRVFDYVRGETADVERLDGGNPALRAPRRDLWRFGLALRPLRSRNLSLTVEHSRSRLRDPIAILPAPTADIEAAFPGRFERAADGRLRRVDARPVNFDRAERDRLRSGLVFSKALPAAPSPSDSRVDPRLRELVGETDRSGRLQLALFHTLHLRDRVRVVQGGAWLDFLEGAPGGARPRHEVEAQAGLFRSGMGLRADARWQSAMHVQAPAAAGDRSYRLDHSALLRLDLQLFVDLGEQPRLRARAPWTRGMRLTLAVDNLFDRRLRIRDESGATPRALQPAYLDPAGRAVRLTLRKLF